jgi:hypothetical protein
LVTGRLVVDGGPQASAGANKINRQCDSSTASDPWAVDLDCQGFVPWTAQHCSLVPFLPKSNPLPNIPARPEGHGGAPRSFGGWPTGNSMMVRPVSERRQVSPVRLTLASSLGHDIDGAWWPRTAHMAGELPELIAVLGTRLGAIIDIELNWSSSQSPPAFDSYGWEGMHPHVMTVSGRRASVNLLIVSHRTSAALAVMVLRLAANLPISPPHRDTQACRTADCIVRAARTQRASRGLRLP